MQSSPRVYRLPPFLALKDSLKRAEDVGLSAAGVLLGGPANAPAASAQEPATAARAGGLARTSTARPKTVIPYPESDSPAMAEQRDPSFETRGRKTEARGRLRASTVFGVGYRA